MASFFNAGRPTNQRRVVSDALNSNGDIQRISQLPAFNQAYSNALNSNLPIQDASFLRLKTFSLGYNLPESLLKSFLLRIQLQCLITEQDHQKKGEFKWKQLK